MIKNYKNIIYSKILETELQKLKNEYETIFNNTHDAMFFVDVLNDDSLIYKRFNRSYEEATGLKIETNAGKTPKQLLGEDLGSEIEERYLKCVRSKAPITYKETVTLPSGTKTWLTTLSPIIENERVIRIIGSSKDITIRQKALEALQESEQRYSSLFYNNHCVMLIINPDDAGIVDANPAACLYYGYNINEIKSLDISQINTLPKQEILDNLQMAKKSKKNHFLLKHRLANGLIKDVEVYSSFINIGGKNLLYSIIHDISERKKAEAQIKYLSFHDKLTGLYNRAFFDEKLNILNTKRQLPLSLIIGDLNGLKLTNDVFGHLAGDKLLKKIAVIFKEVCRREAVISRWGGDEFAIILPRTSEKDALALCNRIKSLCDLAESDPIKPSIALGVSTKKEITQEINNVMKDAEDIMYKHKLIEGKSFRRSVILSLQKNLFEKSFETQEHISRMQEIALSIGKKMNLTENDKNELRLLVMLHDIGMIGISDYILGKKGKLTEIEWSQIKSHPEIGFRIAKSSTDTAHIAELILAHHERWDGKGYSQGLVGEKIPRISRIFSIIDAYDVMIHEKPYKKALSHFEAVEEIKRCSGSQFDPKLADIFINFI